MNNWYGNEHAKKEMRDVINNWLKYWNMNGYGRNILQMWSGLDVDILYKL